MKLCREIRLRALGPCLARGSVWHRFNVRQELNCVKTVSHTGEENWELGVMKGKTKSEGLQPGPFKILSKKYTLCEFML